MRAKHDQSSEAGRLPGQMSDWLNYRGVQLRKIEGKLNSKHETEDDDSQIIRDEPEDRLSSRPRHDQDLANLVCRGELC